MAQSQFNLSKEIKNTIKTELLADTYFQNLLKEHAGQPSEFFKVYEVPLDIMNINKFPAIAIYDQTDIEYDYAITDDLNYMECTELFCIDVIDSKSTWDKAKDSVKNIFDSIRLTLGIPDVSMGFSNANLRGYGVRVFYEQIKPLPSQNFGSQWSFLARMNLKIKYIENLIRKN